MAKSITKLLKQAQRMQSQMAKVQEDLAQKQLDGTAGGGMVKVVMRGSGEVVSVSINPEIVNREEVEMLEDMIVAALHNAHEKVKEMSESVYGGLSDGLSIPGLTE